MKKVMLNTPDLAGECTALLAEKGTVLLLPTETVYGLVASWDDEEAKERIYLLKNRPKEKLLGLFIPGLEALERIRGGEIPEKVRRLAERFMPGPLTIILPDGKGGTVGFRIPDHPLLLSILQESNCLLAQTSANASGTPPGKNMEEALAQLTGEVTLAVDGGRIPHAPLSSTIVLFKEDFSWQILREGPVSENEIREAMQEF